MSYDEPDALAAFARERGITYPLLSDPDSEIITRLGILNTLVDPDDHPWFGIPFPGTYVLDADGVITHKFFEGNLGVRANSAELLAAAQGERVELPAAAPVESADLGVEVVFDADVFSASVRQHLTVRVSVPGGQHVYAAPAPDGMIPFGVELDDTTHITPLTAIVPDATVHHLDGTDEVFPVYDGVFEFRQPLIFVNNGFHKLGLDELTISGRVRWQACDDLSCGLPGEQRFEFSRPVSGAIGPWDDAPDGAEAMDNRAHFARMTERRRED